MTPPCESCGTVEAVTYRVDGWRCQPCRSDWFDQTDDCPPGGPGSARKRSEQPTNCSPEPGYQTDNRQRRLPFDQGGKEAGPTRKREYPMTTFRYPQPPKSWPCPNGCGLIGTAHRLNDHLRDTGAAETLPPGRCPVLFQRRNVNRPGIIGALIERGHCHEAA